MSVDCLFSRSSKLQLPYTALTGEVKVPKARNDVILDEYTYTCVSNSGIVVDGRRKANTAKEVDDAKSRLRMRVILGVPNREKRRHRLDKGTVLSVKYKERTEEIG